MIKSFQKTIATPGAAEQVSTDTAQRTYRFRAHPTNTGNNVYIGGPDVSSSIGFPLGKNDVNALEMLCRLSEMWADVDTGGDKLCVLLVVE